MNARSLQDPLPFQNPDCPPDSQIAMGMIIDLRRQVQRHENLWLELQREVKQESKFWKRFASAALLLVSSFFFYAWTTGVEEVQEIREDIRSGNGSPPPSLPIGH